MTPLTDAQPAEMLPPELDASELSGDVWIVAPETNQSGASHSLTLHEPLRLRQIDERAFAVRGTPTDSVIMGVRHILKDKGPDLGSPD